MCSEFFAFDLTLVQTKAVTLTSATEEAGYFDSEKSAILVQYMMSIFNIMCFNYANMSINQVVIEEWTGMSRKS